MTLTATRIDPRYANSIDEAPNYRVDFWTGDSASDEWRLGGANDINGVLAWAGAHADGRSIVIYVEVTGKNGIGLARIFGHEP